MYGSGYSIFITPNQLLRSWQRNFDNLTANLIKCSLVQKLITHGIKEYDLFKTLDFIVYLKRIIINHNRNSVYIFVNK